MGIQDKNSKNSVKSKNYPKSKTLRELKKLDIDWLVYYHKAKFTVQWVEEHIGKDVCRLNSKLASITVTLKLSLVYLAFFQKIFFRGAKSIVMQISFVSCCFRTKFQGGKVSGGGGANSLRGVPPVPPLVEESQLDYY